MNQKFYIAVDGQQLGPFSIDELRIKGIQRDTLVWTEGLENWTKAQYLPFLKDILKAVPPPLPQQDVKSTTFKSPPPPLPPPHILNVPKEKYFGYELASRRERFFAAILGAIIMFIPLFMIFGENLFNDNEKITLASTIKDAIIGAIEGVILGAIFYPLWSGNLGHKIFGLKVISAEDGSDYKEASRGAIREAVKGALSAFIIPVMWLLWDDDRQNLYDKAVKTYVVKKKLEQ
ncbi:MAG: RDD family protein [Saprospiraceae bacterium]|nr:RDD family protein [Saprospiraceae bacterium]